jgi:SAM-dependent methyltransferase
MSTASASSASVPERNTGLRAVLTQPRVYDTFQRAVGAVKVRRTLLDDYLRPARGQRILDIGCGPGEMLDALPDVEYVGFDVSEAYIDAARARYGTRGTFFVGDVAAVDPPSLGRFDRVLAMGVLHHVDDATARDLLGLAARVLTDDGILATIDPTFSDRQNRIARMIVARDRGQHVRRVGAYEALARTSFDDIRVGEHHNLLRFPYSHGAMACAKPRR